MKSKKQKLQALKRKFTVTVFGSSSPDTPTDLLKLCHQFGVECARNNWAVKNGGGMFPSVMGGITNGILETGGIIKGIIFKNFMYRVHKKIQKLTITPNITKRKTLLLQTDCVVVFPGGIGTLDELFHVLAAKQAGLSNIPVIIFNFKGYYTGLMQWFEKSATNEITKKLSKFCYLYTTTSECLNKLKLIEKDLKVWIRH
ncbi:MAG: TIGR00730 family Rossman fold protein [Planctomycetes bacterium]|nr:TIGR00730 family Rossman fold protein [Planctomycetota bacterium]